MRRRFQRQISFLLALCMVLTLLPSQVFASETGNVSNGSEDTPSGSEEKDLTTFQLYNVYGKAAVRHVCKSDNGVYNSEAADSQVRYRSSR